MSTSAGVRDEYRYHGHQEPHTAPYLWPVAAAAVAGYHRVLDLGCGSGAFAAHLAQAGHEVVGLDSSASGIAAATATHPGIRFVEASAYDDLTDLGAFDAVVSLEVIEHCYSPRKLVRTMVLAARPGGLVVLSTPYHGYLKNLALAITGRWDAHLTALWDHGHIKFFSPRTITKLLGEAGVTSIAIRRVGRVPPFAKSMLVTGRCGSHSPIAASHRATVRL